MRILVTGAAGFLGWHLQVRLRALTDHEVVAVDLGQWQHLSDYLTGVEAVIHLAGINRGSETEVREGNIKLADELITAISASRVYPKIIYANSIHSAGDTPYGIGKRGALSVLREYQKNTGAPVVNVCFPNLFGEHGRPGYNSFVATFAHAVANDQIPDSVVDNQVPLLWAQDAAQVLIDALTSDDAEIAPAGRVSSVVEVLDKLKTFRQGYKTGLVFPNLDDSFDEALFNTLRAAMFPGQYPLALKPHADERGQFVEIVKNLGGQGQTSISTTKPGITRGNHYHLHKAERFAVISGKAQISLRRVGTDEIVDFEVSGDKPVAVDMPTMWSHSITNIGSEELITLFWINRLFDPEDPDTYYEPVR